MNTKFALGAGHVGQQALGSGHACGMPLLDARQYGVSIRHISDASLAMPEEGMQQLVGNAGGFGWKVSGALRTLDIGCHRHLANAVWLKHVPLLT